MIKPLTAAEADSLIDDAGAIGLYRKWRDGVCPCCGMELDWYDQMGTTSEAVAEGVTYCGRCIRNQHHRDEGGRAMIRAIVRGRILVEATP